MNSTPVGVKPARAYAARARVWVPASAGEPFPGPDVFAALPHLRVVQLLSAGAERFAGRLPEGVAVLADSWWRARKGAEALEVAWRGGADEAFSSAGQLAERTAELLAAPAVPLARERKGKVSTVDVRPQLLHL